MIDRHKKPRLIGSILVESGVISREHLDHALHRQKEVKQRLGEILIGLGYASEDDITEAISLRYQIPYIDVHGCQANPEALDLIPEDVAREHGCFPIDTMGHVLTVAASNPLAKGLEPELRRLTGRRILLFISTPTEVRRAINRHYRSPGAEQVELDADWRHERLHNSPRIK